MKFILIKLSIFIFIKLCATEIPRLYVKGTPEEMGIYIAKTYPKKILQLQKQFVFMLQKSSNKSLTEIHQKSLEISQKMAKEDLAEIRSMAKQLNVKYVDMLTYNIFYSLSYSNFACRQFAIWGEGSKTGELLHARNLDWFDYPGSLMRKNNLIDYKLPRKRSN